MISFEEKDYDAPEWIIRMNHCKYMLQLFYDNDRTISQCSLCFTTNHNMYYGCKIKQNYVNYNDCHYIELDRIL